MDMTVAIDERLEYFQELEHATRMLNHPGESLVLQTDFLYMVERVDICIDYLKAHVSPRWVASRTLANTTVASLQRGGSVPPSIPAVYDAGDDVNQDVFRGFLASPNSRRFQATV